MTFDQIWCVDPVGNANEVARFWAKAVRGPGPADCWLWTGAIADDGYGRFWIRRSGVARVVRPHRYALALALHVGLDDVEVAEHAVCDVPICIRAEGKQGDHVWASTQAENLARMGWRGRGGGPDWARRFRGVDRAGRAAASRELRAVVIDGWDSDAIAAVLSTVDAKQPLLW